MLIDPPYELAKEYRDVVRAIHQSHKRWATGIYAIWYPVVNRHDIEDMIEGLEALGIRKILQIELGVAPDTNERGMTASGMIVINPPWKLESQMKESNNLPIFNNRFLHNRSNRQYCRIRLIYNRCKTFYTKHS